MCVPTTLRQSRLTDVRTWDLGTGGGFGAGATTTGTCTAGFGGATAFSRTHTTAASGCESCSPDNVRTQPDFGLQQAVCFLARQVRDRDPTAEAKAQLGKIKESDHRAAGAVMIRRLPCSSDAMRDRILDRLVVEADVAGFRIRLSRSITSVRSGLSTSPPLQGGFIRSGRESCLTRLDCAAERLVLSIDVC